MTLAELVLGLGHAAAAGELVLARRNTARAAGARRGRGRARPLSADRRAARRVAVSLWVFGHDSPSTWSRLPSILALQGLRVWVMRTLGRALDDAHHRPARRAAGGGRALPLSVASQLCRRCRRDRRPAAGFRPAAGSPWSSRSSTRAVLSIRIRAEERALAARANHGA